MFLFVYNTGLTQHFDVIKLSFSSLRSYFHLSYLISDLVAFYLQPEQLCIHAGLLHSQLTIRLMLPNLLFFAQELDSNNISTVQSRSMRKCRGFLSKPVYLFDVVTVYSL